MSNSGVDGLITATGIIGIAGSLVAVLAPLGLMGIDGILAGPLGWGALLIGGNALRKKIKEAKLIKQEKGRLKNETIRKQQAIINKLKKENEYNKVEIKNLKETLEALEEILREMQKKSA